MENEKLFRVTAVEEEKGADIVARHGVMVLGVVGSKDTSLNTLKPEYFVIKNKIITN